MKTKNQNKYKAITMILTLALGMFVLSANTVHAVGIWDMIEAMGRLNPLPAAA